MNAVLIIDKPAGLTSHYVVARARRILKERSIGHLGTLDPMATGVLPLVAGSFTRLAQFYTGAEKVYEGVIRFGFSTDTYDAEGDPTSPPQLVTLRVEEIEALAAKFRGVIQQVPPPFSAKKIKGVPAYKLARKHKEVVLEPVQVEIKEFAILSVEADRVRFRARVTSGTYMRSVAHDMGHAVGCGAHLESLRRTAVAEFTLADAHTLDELATAIGKDAGEGPIQTPSSPTECCFPGGKTARSGGACCYPPRHICRLGTVLRPSPAAAATVPVRHRRRSHRRPHPRRTPHQSPRTLPRAPSQSLRRTARSPRHRHPRRRDAVPSQDCVRGGVAFISIVIPTAFVIPTASVVFPEGKQHVVEGPAVASFHRVSSEGTASTGKGTSYTRADSKLLTRNRLKPCPSRFALSMG